MKYKIVNFKSKFNMSLLLETKKDPLLLLEDF